VQRNLDVAIVRAFVTVVDTGSVTKAARLLHLSQGAISQQIKRLEDALDGTLFRRQGRALALSPKGHSVLAMARDYVAANDELVAALRLPEFQGEVRFGAPYDIIGSYTPPILRRFGRAFPAIRVTLVCQDSLLLLSAVKSGDIDLALTTEPGCSKGGETLRRDRLVWAGAKGGEAHARNPLPLSLGSQTCIFRPAAIGALRKSRRAWKAVCEISNMEPVRATLEADLAIAPLLQHSVPASLEVLSDNKGLPKLPSFRINLYVGARRNSVVRAFADEVRSCVMAGLSG
jgi:DNA-binding transcriptional LysR family regulator